jgi:hypothetical protein
VSRLPILVLGFALPIALESRPDRDPPDGGSSAAVPAAAPSQDPALAVGWGKAPDGELGFGPGRTIRDVERHLR